jgi:6-pyruvoyltetrahydropterin/6-carboxytetrahydropterin synthase
MKKKSVQITKRIEFDAGHRLPDHNSKCRNVHGHRYALEITLDGSVVESEGVSDRGMVMDFSDVKAIANTYVVEPWDHAFLVYEGDHSMLAFLESQPEQKTIILSKVPTVENLAVEIYHLLEGRYRARFGNQLRLSCVRLYETPNSWAEYSA